MSLILSASYSLKLGKNVLFGDNQDNIQNYSECKKNEKFVLGVLILLILYLGITPDLLFNLLDKTVSSMIVSISFGKI